MRDDPASHLFSQSNAIGVQIGCIFSELMCRRPLFPGVSDVDQVARIFQVMGTPTDKNWPVRAQKHEFTSRHLLLCSAEYLVLTRYHGHDGGLLKKHRASASSITDHDLWWRDFFPLTCFLAVI